MAYLQSVISQRAEPVRLPGGPGLAVREAEGPLRPFLLVHDVDEDGGSWDPVAERLNDAGHQVLAVDLRGHGRSDAPARGYDTDTCADDVACLLEELGLAGARSPVLVGHGWGANVAMSLAARRDGIAALGCLDGGWLRPSWRHATERDWQRAHDVTSGFEDGGQLHAERRRSIQRSIFLGDPRGWYPLVDVPVLLCPLAPPDGRPDPAGRGQATRTGVAEAVSGLPRARVSWYYGDDDALGCDPAALVDDLLRLAAWAEPAP